MFKKIISLLLFCSVVGVSQQTSIRVGGTTKLLLKADSSNFYNAIRNTTHQIADSIAIPAAPPQGQVYIFARGTLGLFVKYSNGTVSRLDSAGSGGADSTSWPATDYDVSLKLAASDTASLSNRINLKLTATDTASLSNRINLKANAAAPALTGEVTIDGNISISNYGNGDIAFGSTSGLADVWMGDTLYVTTPDWQGTFRFPITADRAWAMRDADGTVALAENQTFTGATAVDSLTVTAALTKLGANGTNSISFPTAGVDGATIAGTGSIYEVAGSMVQTSAVNYYMGIDNDDNQADGNNSFRFVKNGGTLIADSTLMSITDQYRVGIGKGNTAPLSPLSVYSLGTGTDTMGFNLTNRAKNITVNTVAGARDTSAFNFRFTSTGKPLVDIKGITGNSVLIIDSGANVGIGITPISKLDVNGQTRFRSHLRWNNATAGTKTLGMIYDGNSLYIGDSARGTSSPVMRIEDSLNVIAVGGTPTQRYKFFVIGDSLPNSMDGTRAIIGQRTITGTDSGQNCTVLGLNINQNSDPQTEAAGIGGYGIAVTDTSNGMVYGADVHGVRDSISVDSLTVGLSAGLHTGILNSERSIGVWAWSAPSSYLSSSSARGYAAFQASGTVGWRNFLVFKNTGGTTQDRGTVLMSVDSAANIYSNGKMSLGTTSFNGPLTLQSSTASTEMFRVERTSATAGVRLLNYEGTTNTFQWQGSTNLSSWTALMSFNVNRSSIGINGGTNTSGVGVLAIKSGTAPTSVAGAQAYLYATAAGEMMVMDSSENATPISPHNFSGIPEGPSEEMAWAFYSERDGQYVNVDMLKLARLVEKLTGEKLVYIGRKDN